VKLDGLVSGGNESRQRGGGGKTPARPGQLALAQATFFSFPKPISLEILLKPGGSLGVALELILSGTTLSSSLPMHVGGAEGSPPRTPRVPETPVTCPWESKPVQRAGKVPRQGRNEQPPNTARAEASQALTEVFWHWMLVLLKRRAVTRVVLPGMWKMHS